MCAYNFIISAVLECSELTVGKPSTPVLPPSTPIELSRVMNIDDANPNGNVHGGVMLRLMEQAGEIVANRHCNKSSTANQESPVMAALVRVDHMDFHRPMFVGEIGQIQAAVTYTSQHSLEITVDAWAENMFRGNSRHTNSATLWYITTPVLEQMDETRELGVVGVPQLTGLSNEQREAGRSRYESQKVARALVKGGEPLDFRYDRLKNEYDPEKHMILASQSTLANIVLPSDCTVTGHLLGGALMKLMDDAAAICASTHCGGLTVTACIDAIDFHSPIACGEVVFVTARLSYISRKSMEIEVISEAEGLRAGSRRVTTTAYFTYVAVGDDMRAKTVPPLQLKTDAEKRRFEEGKQRYETRKTF